VYKLTSTGATSSIENLGEMTNKGLEFTVKGIVVKIEDFNVEIYGNMSRNRNEVTKLNQPFFPIRFKSSAGCGFQLNRPVVLILEVACNPDGSLLLMPDGFTNRAWKHSSGSHSRNANGQPFGMFK
jgi:hypothetical protein